MNHLNYNKHHYLRWIMIQNIWKEEWSAPAEQPSNGNNKKTEEKKKEKKRKERKKKKKPP